MKNQYFGDKRDLFKFDLLLDLMASGGFCVVALLNWSRWVLKP